MSLYQKLKDNFGGDGRHLLAFDSGGYDYILKELDRLRLHFAERAEHYKWQNKSGAPQKTRFKGLEAAAIALSEKLQYNDDCSICFSFNGVFSGTNEIYSSTEQKNFRPSSVRDNIREIFGRINVELGFRGGSEKLAVSYKRIEEVEYGYITSSARIR